jgi:hypothetical protein
MNKTNSKAQARPMDLSVLIGLLVAVACYLYSIYIVKQNLWVSLTVALWHGANPLFSLFQLGAGTGTE